MGTQPLCRGVRDPVCGPSSSTNQLWDLCVTSPDMWEPFHISEIRTTVASSQVGNTKLKCVKKLRDPGGVLYKWHVYSIYKFGEASFMVVLRAKSSTNKIFHMGGTWVGFLFHFFY